eukprot:TRINITY_DN73741_c0_g1_i1.p1 TRINITY_DN73741_c0_g1~~TRINITY_DN73741_c0_g1_i1.p1  ORF type:complete len:167 (+),score=39.86 TRINITY_DN73741_c0_g1_i1:61-561(+)
MTVAAAFDCVRHLPSFHRAAPAMAQIIRAVRDDADANIVPGPVTLFHTTVVPAVSIERYIVRLIKYSHCSPSVLIAMFILLDRFARSTQLTSRTVHRAMAAAFIVAVYAHDDQMFKYSFYATVCGLRDSAEVHELVLAFLCKVGLGVGISSEEYSQVEAALLRESA